MFELRQTETFHKWRTKLKDLNARAAIASRLDRLALGHVGDAQPVGEGISELASTTVQDTGSTFGNMAERSSSSYAAATKALKPKT